MVMKTNEISFPSAIQPHCSRPGLPTTFEEVLVENLRKSFDIKPISKVVYVVAVSRVASLYEASAGKKANFLRPSFVSLAFSVSPKPGKPGFSSLLTLEMTWYTEYITTSQPHIGK